MFLARRRSGKETANVLVNVYIWNQIIRIPHPYAAAAYAYRVYGILALLGCVTFSYTLTVT